jgi:hypothetical protein
MDCHVKLLHAIESDFTHLMVPPIVLGIYQPFGTVSIQVEIQDTQLAN